MTLYQTIYRVKDDLFWKFYRSTLELLLVHTVVVILYWKLVKWVKVKDDLFLEIFLAYGCLLIWVVPSHVFKWLKLIKIGERKNHNFPTGTMEIGCFLWFLDLEKHSFATMVNHFLLSRLLLGGFFLVIWFSNLTPNSLLHIVWFFSLLDYVPFFESVIYLA